MKTTPCHPPSLAFRQLPDIPLDMNDHSTTECVAAVPLDPTLAMYLLDTGRHATQRSDSTGATNDQCCLMDI